MVRPELTLSQRDVRLAISLVTIAVLTSSCGHGTDPPARYAEPGPSRVTMSGAGPNATSAGQASQEPGPVWRVMHPAQGPICYQPQTRAERSQADHLPSETEALASLSESWSVIMFARTEQDNGLWIHSPRLSYFGSSPQFADCGFILDRDHTYPSVEACEQEQRASTMPLGTCQAALVDITNAPPLAPRAQTLFRRGGTAYALETAERSEPACIHWRFLPEDESTPRIETRSTEGDETWVSSLNYSLSDSGRHLHLMGPHTVVFVNGREGNSVTMGMVREVFVRGTEEDAHFWVGGERWFYRRADCETALEALTSRGPV